MSHRKSRATPARATKRKKGTDPPPGAFPIVGIGASAGGLEAVTGLLRHLPARTGMAFVFVQHLDPTHESLLVELLAKTTAMPVLQATEGQVVRPDHLYVIPPKVDMTISEGMLRLEPRTDVRGQHLPVDAFLRSLARDQKDRAIGVILSGTASDGAAGMKEIKAGGGLTFAQSEESARHGGMPRSAVASGAVDFVLHPEGIARALADLARHPSRRAAAPAAREAPGESTDVLGRIFSVLRRASGVDFSIYKKNTILRRIRRRMALHRLERLDDYLAGMEEKPDEVRALYEDLLIDVTAFFRDPGAFEAVRTIVIPGLLKTRAKDGALRVWVPGCSTGEEAYSIAILLMEVLGEKAPGVVVQIFATDVSEAAIEEARAGVYRESVAADLAPDRLSRFFVRTDRGYQVQKSIRDLCVFAKQDITRDPPFSRIDLISCRNVLIYLEAALQKRVMPIFHYALKPTGYLWLGNSESIGGFGDLFTPVDRKHRIYAARATASRPSLDFATPGVAAAGADVAGGAADGRRGSDIFREADRIVMTRYAPASVLINDDMEILQFRGHTGAWLEPAAGQASLNVLKMAREGLAPDLRSAIHKARTRDTPIRRTGVVLGNAGRSRTLDIEVIPLRVHWSRQRYYLVTFEEARPQRPGAPKARKAPARQAPARESGVARLRRELVTAREHLQAVIEDQEATNEDLKSANEEILSANEELQSTNEELETSKEELQSANEELSTVNEALQNGNAELSLINDDHTNVLSSVNIPIVILGPDLRVRRFTPMAGKVLNLIPGDLGRRVTDLRLNVVVSDLEGLIVDVIESIKVCERSVQDRDGRWYSMRILPYRTSDDRIDGAVLAFVDIDDLTRGLRQLRESEDYAQAIVETVREGLVVLDEDLRVKKANRSFYEMFQGPADETEGRRLQDLGRGQWNIPGLIEKLQGVGPGTSGFEDFEVTAEFPGLGQKSVVLSARSVDRAGSLTNTKLLAIRDISRRMRSEKMLKDLSRRVLHMRDEEQRRIARELHDSTAQNLSALAINLVMVEKSAGDLPPKASAALAESRDLAESCARELHDLATMLHPPLLDEVGLVSAVKWLADTFSRRTGIKVNLEGAFEPAGLALDVRTTLFRIIQESLTNVQRHSGSRRAWVRFARVPSGVEVLVRDEGRGAPDSGDNDTEPVGVGIIGMRERVRQVGGAFDITSGKAGTTVRVRVPLTPDVA